MNVLMVNHPAAEKYHGGDLVQMRKTAEALRFYGVRVAESFAPEPSTTGRWRMCSSVIIDKPS